MGVCQFFLEGHCRFGDRCWNQHVSAENYYGREPRGSHDQQRPERGPIVRGSQFHNQQDYHQPQQRHQQHHPQQSAGTGFSFTKTLQNIQRQEENEGGFQRKVRFDQHETPKNSYGQRDNYHYNASSSRQQPLFGNSAAQPKVASSGFSFARALQQVESNAQVTSTPLFGKSRTLVSYDDVDMDGAQSGPGPGTDALFRPTATLFGNSHQMSGNIYQQPAQLFQQPISSNHPQPQADNKQVQIHYYSEPSALTSEELAEYCADFFTFGKIPTSAPPQEVCF